ncbi:alpha/beta hydrolase fold domain-containing protein [Cupriavidus basilensis]
MQWFRDLYVPAGTPLDQPALSPLPHAEGRRQPPMFIATVGLDPLCDEGIEYAAMAARAGGLAGASPPASSHGIFTAAGRISTAPGSARACRLIHSSTFSVFVKRYF